MADLSQGGNTGLSGGRVAVTLAWPHGAPAAIDASAYLLTAAGVVRDDGDMAFYNQPAAGNGAVRLAGANPARFEVDPGAVPAAIERIVFCVAIDGAGGRTLASIDGASAVIEDGGEVHRFRPTLAGAREAAMIVCELYRRAGAWKLRAVGQGFDGGTAPLARSFGVDVADEAPPPPPVSLAKITLDKPGQKVSLEKKGAGFGDIVVNLNWSRGRGGWGSNAVDLDLACLYGLKSGERHAVQALGRQFGAFDRPPYIELSGDDRTGDVGAGETMRINGRHWDRIERVLVFATIYEGVANWQATNGVVTVAVPGQPVLEVPLTGGRSDRRLCGIALIENVGDRIELTRVVDYFSGAQALDRAFGWGLRWTAGRKD